MTFAQQEDLCRTVGYGAVWLDVGGHESVGWAARKAAEQAHAVSCGPVCPPLCGPAAELLSLWGVPGRCRGDLIVPRDGTMFSLEHVLSLSLAVGASCSTIVVDDLGALLAQKPTPIWWRSFAESADASTDDGVRVLLLMTRDDYFRWPEGLPQPAYFRRGSGWCIAGGFGSTGPS